MPSENLDDESNLPKATVDKLVQCVTPDGYVVTRETRALLREAAHAFLNLVALEANRICDVEKKKTISVAHVYKAIEGSGFEGLIEECKASAKDYDEYSRQKPSKQNKFKESGKSMEELQRMQMELFRKAAEEQMDEYEEEKSER